ncbi:hypothetical protein HK104_000039, partial [Borealophlyctis nickersoniae]
IILPFAVYSTLLFFYVTYRTSFRLCRDKPWWPFPPSPHWRWDFGQWRFVSAEEDAAALQAVMDILNARQEGRRSGCHPRGLSVEELASLRTFEAPPRKSVVEPADDIDSGKKNLAGNDDDIELGDSSSRTIPVPTTTEGGTTDDTVTDQDEHHMSSDELCVLCLADYEPGERLRELACRHRFHAVCIDPWLMGTGNGVGGGGTGGRSGGGDKAGHRTCPICKRDAITNLPVQPSERRMSSVASSSRRSSTWEGGRRSEGGGSRPSVSSIPAPAQLPVPSEFMSAIAVIRREENWQASSRGETI